MCFIKYASHMCGLERLPLVGKLDGCSVDKVGAEFESTYNAKVQV